jgi:hypothetical protein
MSAQWYDGPPSCGSYDPDPPSWCRERRVAPVEIDERAIEQWDASLPPPPVFAQLNGDDDDEQQHVHGDDCTCTRCNLARAARVVATLPDPDA